MKGLSVIFKQGTKQDYAIQKQQHKIKNKNMRCAKQTRKWIFIMLTFANMNMIRIWYKSVPKINVEHNEKNEGSYFYLYPFEDLAQGSFEGGFYVCI